MSHRCTSFWVAALFVLASCKCLPVPASDSTAPAAKVIVEFREPGKPGTRTVSAAVGDADVTVTADREGVVAVLYSGGDNQGLRSVRLAYDMRYSTGTTVVRPLLVALKVESRCPRAVLLDSENFEADGHPWRYEFAAESTNWLGLTSRSGTVRVVRQ